MRLQFGTSIGLMSLVEKRALLGDRRRALERRFMVKTIV